MTECPTCHHKGHDGTYCSGWDDCPDCDGPHPCACSYPDPSNFSYLPPRSDPEPGLEDVWWRPKPTDPLVNGVAVLVAHHHATNHLCGGGGSLQDCDECDFYIEDGIVHGEGWTRWKADDTPPHQSDARASKRHGTGPAEATAQSDEIR